MPLQVLLYLIKIPITAKTRKQPRCSVGEWINKLWHIQVMKYYWVLKRSELSGHEKTQGNLKCTLLGEGSQSEKATEWFQLYMTSWKRQNYGDSKRITGCQGLRCGGRGKGWIGGAQGILGQWKYFVRYYNDGYISIHLSNPIECITASVNPNVNRGLWVIMMCQCRFMDYNKCTTLVGMLITGMVYVPGGKGHMGNLCTLCSFCCEPKTTHKNKVY